MNYNFDPENPSVRLRRLNLRKPLREAGVDADIVYRFEDLLPYKNILISNLDAETFKEVIQLRKLGKRLFFDHSENLWALPFQSEIFNLCDYIVCCSTKLAELTQPLLTSKFTKCVVIKDMAEQKQSQYLQDLILHQPKETNKLKCVWTGMGGNSYLAKRLKPIINSLGMELSIISEHGDADIKWNIDTYLSEMSKFDICICPQNVELQPAKSNVKLTQAMSLGLPTISSPNPAYLEIVKQGINGFIATTEEEWRDALLKLKDLKLRQSMSQAALQTAKDYTPYAIAKTWADLLSNYHFAIPSVALINNTLRHKYMSYGDFILDNLRLNGYEVTEFRYEDIDSLPAWPKKDFDLYLFVEVRYNPEDIPRDVKPKVLYAKEHQDLNNLPQFDLIVSEDKNYVDQLNYRGFVNVVYSEGFDAKFIFDNLKKDFVDLRKKHNIRLHTDHINSFYQLMPPETRWTGLRDKQHIDFTEEHTKESDKVLDVGSADGWLSVYLAKEKRIVSALDFVERGIEWTKQQAARFNTTVDIRAGCFEDIEKIFNDKKFDAILMYEILEHLDFLKLPEYLEKIERLLLPNGKILISLPNQNLIYNEEHLWSPNEKLIKKTFSNKSNFAFRWLELPDHGTCKGNWFISYSSNSVTN